MFKTIAVLALSLCANPALAADTRTVTDALGRSVEVPAAPQRISILDPLAALEAALSLGIAPHQIGQRSFVAEYLGDPLAQWPWLEAALTALGAEPLRMNADETNLELVAMAEPDLILGADGWVEGLDRAPREAKAFYAVIALATLGGIALNFIGIDPMKALYWAAVVNGLLAPPLMVVTMLIASNPVAMGGMPISRGLKIGGWLSTAVMTAVAAVFLLV